MKDYIFTERDGGSSQHVLAGAFLDSGSFFCCSWGVCVCVCVWGGAQCLTCCWWRGWLGWMVPIGPGRESSHWWMSTAGHRPVVVVEVTGWCWGRVGGQHHCSMSDCWMFSSGVDMRLHKTSQHKPPHIHLSTPQYSTQTHTDYTHHTITVCLVSIVVCLHVSCPFVLHRIRV